MNYCDLSFLMDYCDYSIVIKNVKSALMQIFECKLCVNVIHLILSLLTYTEGHTII